MELSRDLYHAQQTLVALFSVTNKLQMLGDKHLRYLTLRQTLAIPALVHAPGGRATINHLARSMGTSKQSAKQIVDALARKGYLSVAPSGQDRRAVNVSVTAAGRQTFGVCSERTDEFLAALFTNFTSGELEALSTLLQKLFRFDGAARDASNGPPVYDESASEEIVRHHRRFTELRAGAKEPE